MMSDQKDELNFENNYKSCFARSVVVNSQFSKHSKSEELFLGDLLEPLKMTTENDAVRNDESVSIGQETILRDLQFQARSRKTASNKMNGISNSKEEENGSSKSSFSTNKVPVENFFMQSHMEILQWQLKQTEASREMYRAVMKQVVVFLERAHRSLELLGSRLNNKTVPRSRSEHHMSLEEPGFSSLSCFEDLNGSKDQITWRRPKQLPIDETSPEKLSQEAFRLLRTAQSLLNTREPDLAHVNSDTGEDIDFMAQLAKEFPAPEAPQHRATSFSLSPKLLTPERDMRHSSVFNRKFSLPLNCTELRRNSLMKETLKLARGSDSARDSVVESENGVLSPLYCEAGKLEKYNNGPTGSLSSAEDESGFSSMNSFQEVGLPLVNCEETSIRETPVKSAATYYEQHNASLKNNSDDVKLWQKPLIYHQRRNSSPMEAPKQKSTLKVLWV